MQDKWFELRRSNMPSEPELSFEFGINSVRRCLFKCFTICGPFGWAEAKLRSIGVKLSIVRYLELFESYVTMKII